MELNEAQIKQRAATGETDPILQAGDYITYTDANGKVHEVTAGAAKRMAEELAAAQQALADHKAKIIDSNMRAKAERYNKEAHQLDDIADTLDSWADTMDMIPWSNYDNCETAGHMLRGAGGLLRGVATQHRKTPIKAE